MSKKLTLAVSSHFRFGYTEVHTAGTALVKKMNLAVSYHFHFGSTAVSTVEPALV